MTETALTRDQIREAAEDVLRRFGPAKTTVVDIARALGVGHGSVYRHFASKAALAGVAAEAGPAAERLRRWLDLLIAAKRSRARDAVKAHVDTLVGQIARIIADGVARGEFTSTPRPLPPPDSRRRVGRPWHRRRLRARLVSSPGRAWRGQRLDMTVTTGGLRGSRCFSERPGSGIEPGVGASDRPMAPVPHGKELSPPRAGR